MTPTRPVPYLTLLPGGARLTQGPATPPERPLEPWMATTAWLAGLRADELATLVLEQLVIPMVLGVGATRLLYAVVDHLQGRRAVRTSTVPADLLAAWVTNHGLLEVPVGTFAHDLLSEVVERLEGRHTCTP